MVPCFACCTVLIVAAIVSTTSTTLVHAQETPAPSSLPTPLMGWNPFNAFGQNYDEAVVYGQADQLVRLKLADIGYRFVDIDDSWWVRRLPQAVRVNTGLYPDAKLPDDKTSMRPFVDHVHAMGLKAGIYTDIGRNSCSQRFERANTKNLPTGTRQEREIGSYGHQEQDTRLFFSDWGFDLVKVDACGVADYSPNVDVVKNGMFAALEASSVRGRPAASNIGELQRLYGGFWNAALSARAKPQPIISICAWGEADVNDWAYRYGQMWRTSADIKAHWRSVLNNFDSAAPRSLFAGPGRWNDPDMLEVGNGEFDANHLVEAKAHMSMWAIIAAPLIIGTDLRSVSPSILDILGNRDVVAIDQDTAGNQGVIFEQSSSGDILVKQLATRGKKAVAFINRTDEPLTLSLGLDKLHLSSASRVTVHDVWRGTTTSLKNPLLEVNLSPKETALFVVEGALANPAISFPSEMPARIRVLEDGYKPTDRTVNHQWIPAQIGYLPDGQPLRTDGSRDIEGLGVATGSRLQIELNGGFRTISLSPQSFNGEAGRYFIYADGHLRKKGDATSAAAPITVPVKGVRRLELVSPPARDSNPQFAWGQMSFKR